MDENGNVIFNEKGKPVLIPSYSILQDDFFNHMQRAGFNDFIRGEKGSTAEHLSCLQYEIQQDKKRLEEIKSQVEKEEIHYENIHTVHKTFMEIDGMGKKTLTGKVTISSEDFNDLSNMAKQSVVARSKIYDLEQENKKLQSRIWDLQGRINRLSERLHELEQVCAPYLEALRLMPEKVKAFISDVLKTVRKDKTNKNREIKKER